MKVAVVGHVEWIEFLRVEAVPLPGEIVGTQETWEEPAGGGGVAAVELARLAGASSLYCLLGGDDLGKQAQKELEAASVRVLTAKSDDAQRRGFVYIDEVGERTITIIGDKPRPKGGEGTLPWEELDDVDGVYFTAGDAEAVRQARRARVLVATARELPTLHAAGVELDALVASGEDDAERYQTGDLDPPQSWSCRRRFARGWAQPGGPYKAAVAPGPRGRLRRRGLLRRGLTFALATGMEIPDALTFASGAARSRSRVAAPVSRAERRQPYLGASAPRKRASRRPSARRKVRSSPAGRRGRRPDPLVPVATCRRRLRPAAPNPNRCSSRVRRRTIGVTDEAAAVVVRGGTLSYSGREAHRRGSVSSRVWGARQVEELTAALVPEGDQLRPKPLDDGAHSGQAAPRRQVGDRGRAERREVPQHDRVDRRIPHERPAEPRLGRRRSHLCTPAPEPARGDLHECELHLAGVREGSRVEIREPLRKDRAQLGPAPRLLREECPRKIDHRRQVDVPKRGSVFRVASQLSLEDGLHQRPQQQTVVAGDEVNRPA